MDAYAAHAPLSTESPLADGQSVARAKCVYCSLSGGKNRFFNEPVNNGVFRMGCRIGFPAFEWPCKLDQGAFSHVVDLGHIGLRNGRQKSLSAFAPAGERWLGNPPL